jgi:hypothetical protein
MAQPNLQRNPFMLMIDPARVIAAMEKSERLSGLNRHICRPLDRPLPLVAGMVPAAADSDIEGAEQDDRLDD